MDKRPAATIVDDEPSRKVLRPAPVMREYGDSPARSVGIDDEPPRANRISEGQNDTPAGVDIDDDSVYDDAVETEGQPFEDDEEDEVGGESGDEWQHQDIPADTGFEEHSCSMTAATTGSYHQEFSLTTTFGSVQNGQAEVYLYIFVFLHCMIYRFRWYQLLAR